MFIIYLGKIFLKKIKKNIEKITKNKKMILILDLDGTLVHVTATRFSSNQIPFNFEFENK